MTRPASQGGAARCARGAARGCRVSMPLGVAGVPARGGRHVDVVPADGDGDVAVAGEAAVGGVERDRAGAARRRDDDLDPGVGAALADQVPGDVAARDARPPAAPRSSRGPGPGRRRGRRRAPAAAVVADRGGAGLVARRSSWTASHTRIAAASTSSPPASSRASRRTAGPGRCAGSPRAGSGRRGRRGHGRGVPAAAREPTSRLPPTAAPRWTAARGRRAGWAVTSTSTCMVTDVRHHLQADQADPVAVLVAGPRHLGAEPSDTRTAPRRRRLVAVVLGRHDHQPVQQRQYAGAS